MKVAIIQIIERNGKMSYKKQEYYEVQGTSYKLPITTIEGGRADKTFLISAGVHGCEYVGIEALKQWAREVNPSQVNGKIICLHLANPNAFSQRVPELVPEDGKNLNRVFPGKEDGTAAERLAAAITKDFQLKADYFVDLHGGDLHESVTPLAYFAGVAEEKIVEKSREMAQVLCVPLRVRSGAMTGAYNSAARLGVPSILIERGGRGHWSQEEVDAYKQDIVTLLTYFGFLKSAQDKKLLVNEEQIEITKATYLNAPIAGWWYPQVNAGDFVDIGDILGTICDDFGECLLTLEAKDTGTILYMTRTLALKKGEALIAQST